MQVIKLIPSLAVKSKIPDILNQQAGRGSCDYIDPMTDFIPVSQ